MLLVQLTECALDPLGGRGVALAADTLFDDRERVALELLRCPQRFRHPSTELRLQHLGTHTRL
ncbi:MAG TPA: hypothetical protein VI814_09965 [Candidatus Limnocylindria bacterium]